MKVSAIQIVKLLTVGKWWTSVYAWCVWGGVGFAFGKYTQCKLFIGWLLYFLCNIIFIFHPLNGFVLHTYWTVTFLHLKLSRCFCNRPWPKLHAVRSSCSFQLRAVYRGSLLLKELSAGILEDLPPNWVPLPWRSSLCELAFLPIAECYYSIIEILRKLCEYG